MQTDVESLARLCSKLPIDGNLFYLEIKEPEPPVIGWCRFFKADDIDRLRSVLSLRQYGERLDVKRVSLGFTVKMTRFISFDDSREN